MLTRRGFTSSTLLSLGAATAADAQSGDRAAPSLGVLPPAIAVLKNRRKEAQPITVDERNQRVERARQLMREHSLQAICLMGGTSLKYFTGVRWGVSERLFAFVLPQTGAPVYVAPAFEEGRAREQMKRAPLANDSKVITWQEDDDPYVAIANHLRETGVATGNIGLDERMPFVFANGLATALPQAKIVSATPVTAGCRRIKSTAEIALMRLANQSTLQAYEAAWRCATPGMKHTDLRTLVVAAFNQIGFPGEVSIQVGEYSALPHGSPTPQIIRERQMIVFDDGCVVEDYPADITRSFVIGPATDKMKRVFDVVKKAQKAALDTARPQTPCEQVDAAARKVIDASGFGSGYQVFTHRLGHGIGMDMHEWPYLVKGNKLPLEAHMTFSDEPGIYLRGEFGIRLEDDMHILENGAELFTPQSGSLELPFAPA